MMFWRHVPAALSQTLGAPGPSNDSDAIIEPDSQPSAGANATVMVVDDEPGVRAALERALRIERYDVRLAGDGTEALALLAERSPDAIVLDVSMPDVDGLEVCRRLRAAGDRTPVLMLTARDAVDDRVAGLDAGADDYLVKPFALEELQARLRALLRRTEAHARGRAALRRPRARPGRARGPPRRTARSSSRAPSSTCSSCSSSTRARSSPARRSSSACGATTSARRSNALGVYIGYLRRKTEAGSEPRLLHTVRGVGYVLRDHEVTLGRRLILLSVLAVGATVVLASLGAYLATRATLRGPDRRLAARAGPRRAGPRRGASRRPAAAAGRAAAERRPRLGLRRVRAPGRPGRRLRGDDVRVPITPGDVAAARGNDTAAVLSDRDGDGVHLRVITVPLPGHAGRSCSPAR